MILPMESQITRNTGSGNAITAIVLHKLPSTSIHNCTFLGTALETVLHH